jgi:hypothetical protein
MVRVETRIVRPWGVLGSRYEVGPGGIRSYRLAWIAALLAVASIPLHAIGLLPTVTWLVYFLAVLALTAGFTWNTTRLGRKLPDA